MSIHLICPGCRKQLAVPDATAGQMGRCPVCSTLFKVPAEAKPAVESIMPPPPRRTAVARPIPAPAIREETPVTGLSLTQKLVIGAIAVGALAVGGFLGVRSLSPKDSGEEIIADAGKAAAPAREPEPSRPAPVKSEPTPQAPPTKPRDDTSPEEDIGTPAVPTRPQAKPPKEAKPEPPAVTEESPKEPIPKSEPPAKAETVVTKPPAKEPAPESTTEPSAPADDYRPGGASIYARLLKSTAMIIRPEGDGRASRGSGSLVHRGQRLVLTNYHVVGDASDVYVTFPLYENGKLITESRQYMRQFQEKFIKAKVVRVLKGQDLALVQLEKLPAGTPVVRLAPKSAQPGDAVHSIGNPGASDAAWLYTKGEVRQVSHKTWQARAGNDVLPFDAEVLETTSPTNPGDSGGPLVNERCQLVGVTQGADTRARNVSIFLDISEVRKILKEHGVTGETGGGESTPAGGTRTASVAELAKKLQSADARVRADAAAQLAERGDAKVALHDLIAALADADKTVRKQAGSALLQIGTLERGDVEATDLPGLRAGLRDEFASGELHRWTIEALMPLGAQARLAAAELGKALRSEDKETRLAALAALDKLGATARKAAPDVAELLKLDDRFVSARAAMVLLKMDDLIESEDAKSAAGVLINLHRPQSAEDVNNKQLAALTTEAGKALTRIGKPAVPPIRKALVTTFKGGNRATGEDLFNAIARLAMLHILEGMGPSIHSNELERDLMAIQKSDPAVAVREGAKQARAKLRPEK
jgi:S1-C subfamily serine protease